MIKIKIVCVGKIKDSYLNNGISEYLKRLSGYCSVEIIEVKDEKIVDKNSEENILKIEGTRILEKVNDKDYVVLLDLHGKEFSSEQFANKIDNLIFNDHYVIKQENIGARGENYLFVVTQPNSKNIITMYPIESKKCINRCLKGDEELGEKVLIKK